MASISAGQTLWMCVLRVGSPASSFCLNIFGLMMFDYSPIHVPPT